MTSADDAAYLRAKAVLMKADADGRCLYDHLHDVVYAMLDENPLEVAHHPERFAAVSDRLERERFVYADPSLPTSHAPVLPPTVQKRAQQDAALFVQPRSEAVTVIEKPTPFTTITTTTVQPPKAPRFEPLQQQRLWWQHCGVGLPAQECFLIDQSIMKLALAKKLEEVRFFGKIFGTRGNYLVVVSKRVVAEGEEVYEEENNMPKPPRKKVEVDMQSEPAYKGANRVSFWVAPYASGEWTLLPDVTPQHINASRKLKRLFSGELESAVVSYPPFPGVEKHLLRAQLARILAATYICPPGAMEAVVPEEDEPVDEDDDKPKKKPAKYFPIAKKSAEYAPDEEQGVAPLTDLEQWQHAEEHILEIGRCTKVPPKPETDEADAEPEPEPEDPDAEPEEEKPEEEQRELFQPVKKDQLLAVITVPKEPNPEDEEEEEAPAEPVEGEEEKDENAPEKPLEDEEVPDDDPLRKKIYAWTAGLKNTLYKKHSVAVVRSLRWPGAFAFAAQGGKTWGCVYFGDGCKSADHAFTPAPAPPIMQEAKDLTEVKDPTAANEKLVLRGEEPKEQDSEDEKEPEDEDDPQDA